MSIDEEDSFDEIQQVKYVDHMIQIVSEVARRRSQESGMSSSHISPGRPVDLLSTDTTTMPNIDSSCALDRNGDNCVIITIDVVSNEPDHQINWFKGASESGVLVESRCKANWKERDFVQI